MKSFDEKSRNSYNKKAKDYDNTFDGRFTERFKSLLLEYIDIKPGDNILDVACGNGTFLHMLSKRCDIQGYGIDISENMIDSAKRKCPSMIFDVKGCEQTAFQSEMFDVITVCAAYHHFPSPKAFAKEARRILKPHGLLYIADVYYPLIIRMLCNPFVPLSKAGDIKFYSPKEIESNFAAYGFEKVEFRREGHVQIIALRKIINHGK